MATLFPGRYAATVQGDFVVFAIGMRINRPLQVRRWLPVARAMPRMLRELSEHRELGLLHAEFFRRGRTLMTLQYWRSFEQLHAYAHARELQHLPAWRAFNKAVGGNGSVGIFHETYLVHAGEFECVYANMPRFGLAAAGEMVPAKGKLESALGRLHRTE